MSKSFAPVRPRGRKTPPDFASGKRVNVATDDAEFSAVFIRRGPTHTAVAWTRHGRWYTVEVQNRRIRSIQQLS